MHNSVNAANVWLSSAEDLLPQAIDLRRRLHRHPEVGLRLPETARAVHDVLGGFDVQIAQGPSSWGVPLTT